MHEKVEPSRRIPGLDGLRTLAVVMVVFFHVAVNADYRPTDRLASAVSMFVAGGWMGVDLFFVLSGFLITRILLNAKGTEGYFRVFYARRSLRIFPLYYAYVILVTILLPLFHGPTDYWSSFQGWARASVFFYLYNVWSALAAFQPPQVSHLWSLAVEEQFYLIWPFIVYRSSRRTLVRFAIFGLVLSFLARMVSAQDVHTIAAAMFSAINRFDGLLLGSLLAIAYDVPRAWAVVRRVAPYALVIGALTVAALGLHQGNLDDDGSVFLFGTFPLAVAWAGLLVLVLEDGALSRMFDLAPLRRIGMYSYGIYLLHFLVTSYVFKAGLFANRSSLTANLALAAVSFAFCVALAALSFHFFESWFLRHKPRLGKRIAP